MTYPEPTKDKPEEKKPDSTASFDSEILGTGSKIGRFRIEHELGRGAMGVVFLAYDPKLFRSVAIKTVPGQIKNNPRVQQRFQREAQLLAGLNHPNIAAIHDQLEQENGLGYLILEYVPGETLEEKIQSGSIPWLEALAIARQIAKAVAAAYKKGVIHRDLKPANIKITPDGVVKVLDFGLAKALEMDNADPDTDITKPGRMLGSPAYMSPEQVLGNPADHRSDIWAFGCVFFEMLTGRLPFQGETISETLTKILKFSHDWQTLPVEVPSNIRLVLRRCLEKNPNDRYQHIAEVFPELSNTTNTPATPAPESSPTKSRLTAGLLGIFFGGLGIHRFYLGYTRTGIIQISLTLFFCWLTCGVTALIAWIWGLTEGIMILAGSFQKDAHNQNLK